MPKTTKYLANWNTLYELYPNKEEVSKEDFRTILKMFHNLLFDELKEGKVFKLPYHTGILGITKRHFDRSVVDYGFYGKTGETVGHSNLHSEGYRVRTLWLREAPPLLFKRSFKFKLKRDNARKLASLIKNNGYIYKYREENEKYFN